MFPSFSALQRAENSSIGVNIDSLDKQELFQCSSASRKFLNSVWRRSCTANRAVSVLFSEPKIPQFKRPEHGKHLGYKFQCSSASRKFLNTVQLRLVGTATVQGFSALQRAENSSIVRCLSVEIRYMCFSALQRAENSSIVLTY